MSSQLTKERIVKGKSRIAIMKRKLFNGQLLFVLLGVFLFPIGSIAQEDSIKVGTTTRQMLVYAPSGIEENRPLVITMHGRSQTMYDQKNQTQFESVARDNDFVLVYPNAINKSWQLSGTTDVDFILAIIDEMYKIGTKLTVTVFTFQVFQWAA